MQEVMLNNNMESNEQRLAQELSNRPISLVVIETTISLMSNFFAFFGNLLVCVAFYKDRCLRTLSNYYLISLAVSDILMASLVKPLIAATFIRGKWIFGDYGCKFEGAVAIFLGVVSILTMTMAAVNRYYRMVKPSQHRRYFNKKSVLISIVSVWILATYLPIATFGTGVSVNFHPGKLLCLYNLHTATKTQLVFVQLFSVVLPYTVIIFCYYQIYRKVRNHNKMLSNSSHVSQQRLSVEQVKVSKMLFAILVAFTMCWIPFTIIDSIEVFRGQFILPRQVYVLCIFMVGFSSSINPVIYWLMNRTFRRCFHRMLYGRRQLEIAPLPRLMAGT